MDLALNNLQRLICHKTKQPTDPKHYQTINLKDLFKNSKPEEILSFLKEINLFIKISSNMIKHN